MTKWRGSRRQQLSGGQRDRLLAEEAAQREYREYLKGIKARLDLYGEKALTGEEMAYVRKHPGFFYPEEE